MCNGTPGAKGQSPATLHEKVCHATHGIPCRMAHAIGDFFKRLLGRQDTAGGCGCAGHAESVPQAAPARLKPVSGCGGHGANGKSACGCGGKAR